MSHSTLLGTQGRLIILLIARLGTQESRAVLGITGYRSGVRMENPLDTRRDTCCQESAKQTVSTECPAVVAPSDVDREGVSQRG